MEEAVRARAAARDALEDVIPMQLHDLIDDRLRTATMTPGVLTRLSARATDRDYDPGALDRRAAGVQLIYEGLDLTRSLARTEPWIDDAARTEADVDILAADVLVARGFYLLARTEAATKAVDTIRAFGRDETERETGRPDTVPGLTGRALEADVFELAIVAGVSLTGRDPPGGVRSFAVDLARSFDSTLPAAPELVSDRTMDALTALVSGPGPARARADRLWAESGVSDP